MDNLEAEGGPEGELGVQELELEVGMSKDEVELLIERLESGDRTESTADWDDAEFSKYLGILAEDFDAAEKRQENLGRRANDK